MNHISRKSPVAPQSPLTMAKNMLNDEPLRKIKLNEWAEKWRSEHESKEGRALHKSLDLEVQHFELEEDSEMGKEKGSGIKPPCSYLDQVYKWYIRRRGSKSVWLSNAEKKWYEQEEEYMRKRIFENKNWNQKKMEAAMKPLDIKEKQEASMKRRLQEILDQADEIFNAAVKDIFVKKDIHKKSSKISVRIGESEEFDIQSAVTETNLLFGVHSVKLEEDKMREVGQFAVKGEKLLDIIAKYKQVRNVFNDSRRFRDHKLKWLRTLLKKEVEKNGYELVDFERRSQRLMRWEKYERRFEDLKLLKEIYGSKYNPLWDKEKRMSSFEKRMMLENICVDFITPKRSRKKFGRLNLEAITAGEDNIFVEEEEIYSHIADDEFKDEEEVEPSKVRLDEESKQVVTESVVELKEELKIPSDEMARVVEPAERVPSLPEIPRKVTFAEGEEESEQASVVPLPELVPKQKERSTIYTRDILSAVLSKLPDSPDSSITFDEQVSTPSKFKTDIGTISNMLAERYYTKKPSLKMKAMLPPREVEPTQEYLFSESESELRKSISEEQIEEEVIMPEPKRKKIIIGEDGEEEEVEEEKLQEEEDDELMKQID